MTDRVSSMQDYPAPLTVRRTFIEVEPAALRSPSLRACLRGRRARSCPPGDDVREALALVSPGPNRGSAPSRTSITFGSTSSYYTICASGCADNAVIDGWCNSSCGLPSGCVVALDLEPPTPATCTAASTAAPSSGYDSENEAIDGLSMDLSSEAASSRAASSRAARSPSERFGLGLGSPELPTVGSARHYARRCKPCAFILKGCVSGIECKFCHLCEVDERTRRRKAKRERLYEVHKQRKEQDVPRGQQS
mmetsp:Transcript_17993/g.51091  ORF Transcript_17993/g.51091 Transcript_17993/m.51091 type:complete len:251 (-) Transcript_17993:277-1029(-)